MTEAYDEEILKLEAKIEGYDTLESILGSKMQDIKIAGQLKDQYYAHCMKMVSSIRNDMSDAKKAAVLADTPNAAVSVLCDAFSRIEDILLEYLREQAQNATTDSGALSLLRPLITYLNETIAGANEKIEAYQRMLDDPALAEEVKIRRTIGAHPEKLRNKRAFKEVNSSGSKDPEE